MTEHNFDSIIREKLKDVSPPPAGDVWPLFESAMQQSRQAHTPDEHFDKIVKGKVEGLKPGFNPRHWLELKTLLKTIRERKNTIAMSKIMEVAAILLIVITFDKAAFILENQNRLPARKPSATIPAAEYAEALPAGTKNTKLPELSVTTGMQTSPSLSIKVAPAMDDLVHSGTVNNVFSSLPDGNTDIAKEMIVVTDTDSSQVFPVNTTPAVAVSNAHVMDVTANEAETRDITSADFLPDIQPRPESEMALILSTGNEYKPKKKKHLFLSAYASGDVNLINTPFDKFYSLASYNKEALNKSFGLGISSRTGNLEVESGIGYAGREYQPRIVTEQFGQFADHYFEKSLNKIKYDIATVPLQLKYHVLNNSAASFYLMAGATLNLVANATYDISEVLRNGHPQGVRAPNEEARLDEKPFNKGLLNGDKLSDNYFVSVDFGIGIEKRVFGNTSLYVQPSYHRHILSNGIGIGPNQDKIHTSSLQIGIKTAIH